MRSITALIESFPVAGAFTISRGTRTEAVVVTACITDGSYKGYGECTPYARYGETPQSVVAEIEAVSDKIAAGCTRRQLLDLMRAGAARNAIDCALWDLEAKRAGQPAWKIAGVHMPKPVTTAVTVSLGTPEIMAEAARKYADRKLIKVKLGGRDDPERIAAVRAAAPKADLIVDANEAWSEQTIQDNLAACARAKVKLIEQPLPSGSDALLGDIKSPVPLCADESFHDHHSFEYLAKRYQLVNVKLDKTGGLTEAIAVAKQAQRLGLGIMSGCMLCTSLAIAPASLLAFQARYVDLDGPLLLARDRENGLRFEGSTVYPPSPELWG